jgi:Ni/Co efflux regulator RcnB
MRSIAFALVAVLAATTALAAQNDRGPKGRNETQSRGVDVVVRGGGVNLTVQRTIREYYADKPKTAHTLRLGAARNYARGRKLPPGVAKRSLPPDLERRLPVQPGYQYVAVENDVLLIVVSTGIVADILMDIL